ncbi:hypothetical protein A9Q84_18590 [Halobacteriovorax marinus]|uniref:Magnesium chelatase ChlI-like catalytic domain-containing protein n=1 Tax=Halobacteriovorax marinus TaxID=97084 RepID=A0A1Y5F2E2_9BACT|nr:hypothetical protein A9Q84_18590 [Halobacteriovorax marinus]
MIKGLTVYKNTYKTTNVFAYTTNGIPGLEIKIGSKNSKILREKIIYLTRKSQLPIPLKRYVICVEEEDKILKKEELKWLELPILILYWNMANALSISSLDNCLCGGQVSIDGIVKPLSISGKYLHFFNSHNCEKVWKIITGRGQIECLGLVRLPVEEILHLPLVEKQIKIKSIGS